MRGIHAYVSDAVAGRAMSLAAGLAVAVLAGFGLFLLAGGADEHTVLVVNNLVQTLTAIGAGLVCATVAHRGRDRRAGWALMALALVGWGAGQAYWSWSEIIADRETPFPSPADLGFLVFPVAATAAVWRLQLGTAVARARAISDGLTVATSLFIVSWAFVLGPIYDAGADSTLAYVVALAYPVGDLVVLSLVVLMMIRTTGDRRPVLLLSAGLLAMVAADSGFAYLSTTGDYHTGSVVDLGWVAAFLLCAVAAVADRAERADRVTVSSTAQRTAVILPLLPLGGGMAVLAQQAWTDRLPRPVIVAGALLFGLVAVRRAMVLAENARLVETVHRREEQLRYQAFHDPLTGLANRLLFLDRLEHAATLRRNDRGLLTVIFLDLDDFKAVNDRLGHGAGDAVLRDVAERLRACLRSEDTIARLGGDEFAVLLEQGGEDASVLAQRIVDALERPFQVGSARLRVGGSVGLASTESDDDPEALADRLLHSADTAMYAAKRTRKGQFVRWSDDLAPTVAGGDEPGDTSSRGAGAPIPSQGPAVAG